MRRRSGFCEGSEQFQQKVRSGFASGIAWKQRDGAFPANRYSSEMLYRRPDGGGQLRVQSRKAESRRNCRLAKYST